MNPPSFTPMPTWADIERVFGPEPGVVWDRDMANAGWSPLFYAAAIPDGVGGEMDGLELRAHCELHRAPDRWPVPGLPAAGPATDFANTMRCRCARWSDWEGGWVPRVSEADRKSALTREASRIVFAARDGAGRIIGTAPLIERALSAIRDVVAVDLETPGRGRIVATLATDTDVDIDEPLMRDLADAIMGYACAAGATWEIRLRPATHEEMIEAR